jgi:hypothetical protein
VRTPLENQVRPSIKYQQTRFYESFACVTTINHEAYRSWPHGCKDRGLTEAECNDIKNDPDDNVNHESLQEQNRRDCYDEGFEDGKNNNSVRNNNNNRLADICTYIVLLFN